MRFNLLMGESLYTSDTKRDNKENKGNLQNFIFRYTERLSKSPDVLHRNKTSVKNKREDS